MSDDKNQVKDETLDGVSGGFEIAPTPTPVPHGRSSNPTPPHGIPPPITPGSPEPC